MRVDPACKFVDLRAFVATFGIRLERHSKTYFEGRVIHVFGSAFGSQPTWDGPGFHAHLAPEFDDSWMVTLFDAGPIISDDPNREDYYRWPFTVEHELIGIVVFQRPDWETQWWKFKFNSGREYTQPLLIGRSTPDEAAAPTEAKC